MPSSRVRIPRGLIFRITSSRLNLENGVVNSPSFISPSPSDGARGIGTRDGPHPDQAVRPEWAKPKLNRNHSPRLQSGHGVPTQLSVRSWAESDPGQPYYRFLLGRINWPLKIILTTDWEASLSRRSRQTQPEKFTIHAKFSYHQLIFSAN